MKNLDYLIDRIQPYIQGVPSPVVKTEIYDTAREFCERSDIWRDYSNVISQKAGNQFLNIDFGKKTEIFRIKRIIADKVQLSETTNDIALSADPSFFNDDAKIGTPRAYVMVSADNAILTPCPKQDMNIFVYASLRPSMEDGEMPEDILNEYDRVIISGVLAKFYLMKNEPFYDQHDAQYKAREFVFGIQKAQSAASSGNMRKTIKWNMAKFNF